VAVGTDVTWSSSDGIEWTLSPTEATDGSFPVDETVLYDVACGTLGCVIVGSVYDDDGDAAAWWSPDGSSWSRVPPDEAIFGDAVDRGDSELWHVAVGEDGFVAIGGHFSYAAGNPWFTAVVLTSVDGATWTEAPVSEEVFPQPVINADGTTAGVFGLEGGDLAYGPDGYIVVGTGYEYVDGEQVGYSVVWASGDGETWSMLPRDDTFALGGMHRVVYGPNGWRMTGDGLVWIPQGT
jgi:hypothetical protein